MNNVNVIATNAAAQMTAVEIKTMTLAIGKALSEMRGDIGKLVCVSLGYLMKDGTTNHINKLMEVLNVGDRKMVEALIGWATPYKLVSVLDTEEDGQDSEALKLGKETNTLRKVAGKDKAKLKGSERTQEEIMAASGENYIQFMEGFEGDVWVWAQASAKARKSDASKARLEAKKADEAAKAQSVKLKDAKAKIEKMLTGMDCIGEELMEEILDLIEAKRRAVKAGEKLGQGAPAAEAAGDE